MVRVQVLTGAEARAPHLPSEPAPDGRDSPVGPPSAPTDEHTADVQPLGVFSYPAGLLLIDGGEYAGLRATLAAGRLPASWPPELAGIGAAYAGRLAEATELLAARAAMTDHRLDWLNLAVLAPERVDLATLLDTLEPRWQTYGKLVCAHLGFGEIPLPTEEDPAEVRALVLAARATESDTAAARCELFAEALDAATPCPALRALLLAARAEELRQDTATVPEAIADLREALDLLDGTDLSVARAEQYLALGQLLHEQALQSDAPMADAAAQFQNCLQSIESHEAPLTWAGAHRDLAAVYLMMPMTAASDQLRMAVATQSLRKALTVYTREEHPEQWAATSVNLANALVYALSGHREENLVEAVNIYSQVLAERDPDTDPLGYGRVRANQGNALAHLGMFAEATASLHEARYLFETAGEGEMVQTVRSVLDEIARAQVRAGE